MPRHRAPTARSSSKSSRTDAPSGLPPLERAGVSSGTAAFFGEYVVLGTIVRPHGVRGTVLLHTDPSAYKTLRRGLEVWVGGGDQPPVGTKILRVSPHRTGAALDLENVSERDAALALSGRELLTKRTNLPATSANEFYACDLVGCEVFSPSGDKLGDLVAIITTGANDVWIIRGPDGEILVPAVAHAVLDVQLAERRIVVDPVAAVGGHRSG